MYKLSTSTKSKLSSLTSSLYALKPLPQFILPKSINNPAQNSYSSATTKTMDPGPLELRIRSLITENLKPTALEIRNDSYAHRGHASMKGSTSVETHFT
ncbi:Protein BOLA1, chloroplastic [Smittium culicis]|uniref:Protein BOLA1, chloroplastic n=1 Tax=Smittium culicis TaxID=133412 RepID=A0A1R1XNH7_9FUNG|nr:Protein BOLA1, chloroplastic [Smittium culicis]